MTYKQNKGLQRGNNCLSNWNTKKEKKKLWNRKPKIWKPKWTRCVVNYIYIYIIYMHTITQDRENSNRVVLTKGNEK